jgi:hypothetical protein
MGPVLSKMGRILRALHGSWGEQIPYIESLVVSKTGTNAGLPGEGMNEFWVDYDRLTKAEKQEKVRIEYQNIAGFGSRWNDVLSQLGLPRVDATGWRTPGEHVVGRFFTKDEQELEELFPPNKKKFREGRQMMVAHLQKERNEALIKQVKAGRPWVCEVCSLDFGAKYGIRYVEAHHKEPLQKATSERHSTVDDIVLVCPNCHRAVHKYMALNDKELFGQIKATSKKRMADALKTA